MTSDQLYGELEDLVARLGIEIRDDLLEEASASGGGLCTLNGKPVMILDHRLTWEQKNRVLITALRKVNLEAVYIKPYVRQLLERAG